MGGEAAGDDGEADDLEVGMPGLDAAAEGVAARHGLPPSPALERLIDTLFGISCRDQEQTWSDPTAMASRRREGHELACRITQTAKSMLSGLESLYADVTRFHEVVRDNPALLEAIFDADTGEPTCLWLPPEIGILHTLFSVGGSDADDDIRDPPETEASGREVDADPSAATYHGAKLWQNVDDRLSAVIDLPIRPALPRGPVPNAVLRDALKRVRAYWIAASGRGWGMSSLRHQAVREDNEIETLAGDCERFVVDVLQIAGIRFSFAELASTWTAVDKALAKDRSPSGV